MKTLNLGMCRGRHPLPVEGYIFGQEINPLDISGMEKTATLYLRTVFSDMPCDGKVQVNLYVTGLSVALISVINAVQKVGNINLTLYHFDRDSGTYYPQPVYLNSTILKEEKNE